MLVLEMMKLTSVAWILCSVNKNTFLVEYAIGDENVRKLNKFHFQDSFCPVSIVF